MSKTTTSIADVREAWGARWEDALAAWSRFTRLVAPRWCETVAEEQAEDLTQSFAMIRLGDHAVVISLRQVVEMGLEAFPVEVMAHEIGHHVYCPANLTDQGRLLARLRRALPTKESLAPFVANLYADLLINDRLQRREGLRMANVYGALGRSEDPFWNLYMRMYEVLWRLTRGTLTTPGLSPELEADAVLGARVIRAYSKDWLDGAGRFGALVLPYLLEDHGKGLLQALEGFGDVQGGAQDGQGHADGLAEIEDGEIEGAIHPGSDPDLAGGYAESGTDRRRRSVEGGVKSEKRYREPLEYGELLGALGLGLSASEIAMRYYRERAIPHLVRFPEQMTPRAAEPLPEGLEPWDIGAPLHDADWFESVIASPVVIPGVTTVQRTYGTGTGLEPGRRPVDLYVGIDCSGSMPNPQRATSYPVLAGTIVALSALRAGARVMAVLSGEPGETVSTDGFVSTEREVLALLTGYLGTGYGFGVHRLTETFADRRETDRPVHVLLVTDQDMFTMLADVKRKRSGWDVAADTLAKARGGGSIVLNMPYPDEEEGRLADQGWHLHRIVDWPDIVAFAAEFARIRYEARG